MAKRALYAGLVTFLTLPAVALMGYTGWQALVAVALVLGCQAVGYGIAWCLSEILWGEG